MTRITVAADGQITLPEEIRRAVGIVGGDQLEVEVNSAGTIALRKRRPLKDLVGMLGRPPKNADAKSVETPFRIIDL